MDVPTLILLGAAGGALRGLLDVYIRFLDWQTDRRAHRRLPPGQADEPPLFKTYFDPVGDPVAAVVHSAMGAGAAVLFGTTGQISGAYAAVVVGLSAPVILTQLGRVQSVNDALNGAVLSQAGVEPGASHPAQQADPLTAPPPATPALEPAQRVDSASAGPEPTTEPASRPRSATEGPVALPEPERRTQPPPPRPRPAAQAEPFSAQSGSGLSPGVLPTPPTRQGDATQDQEAMGLRSVGLPSDTAAEPGRRQGGHTTPPSSQGPVGGQEGMA
ncbi:hypothetical protein [Streptomyces sp. NPDC093598]|uniref:hypothetical protein n=1 Tax=Streptomyces sp. NPDC093598 TaxID=3366046 RepID=UPI0037FDC0EC